jgi:hypothetical protein
MWVIDFEKLSHRWNHPFPLPLWPSSDNGALARQVLFYTKAMFETKPEICSRVRMIFSSSGL